MSSVLRRLSGASWRAYPAAERACGAPRSAGLAFLARGEAADSPACPSGHFEAGLNHAPGCLEGVLPWLVRGEPLGMGHAAATRLAAAARSSGLGAFGLGLGVGEAKWRSRAYAACFSRDGQSRRQKPLALTARGALCWVGVCGVWGGCRPDGTGRRPHARPGRQDRPARGARP